MCQVRIELTTFGLRDRYSTIELLAQINFHGEDRSQYASCRLVTLIALILTNREIGWIDRARTCDSSVNSGRLYQLSYYPIFYYQEHTMTICRSILTQLKEQHHVFVIIECEAVFPSHSPSPMFRHSVRLLLTISRKRTLELNNVNQRCCLSRS